MGEENRPSSQELILFLSKGNEDGQCQEEVGWFWYEHVVRVFIKTTPNFGSCVTHVLILVACAGCDVVTATGSEVEWVVFLARPPPV